VHMIPCRSDNYSFVLEGPDNKALMVDSTIKGPVMNFIDSKSLNLEYILLTHHHYDHVDALDQFQKKYDCEIYCSLVDSEREDVLGKTSVTKEGDRLNFSGEEIQVFETAGHTKSHLSYFFPKQNILFCGDTVFSLGCGRVFETYPDVYKDFYHSLKKISQICNSDTQIFCAHEYTEANCQFLIKQGLADQKLLDKIQNRLKTESKTVPTSLDFELKHNSFLKALNFEDFKKLRLAKDRF